ncbi:MAG: hypothetical protein H6Q57_2408 [Geobacteraceae bacterium]|nr:hypothetical protein [Geobacteraceae bacterium]
MHHFFVVNSNFCRSLRAETSASHVRCKGFLQLGHFVLIRYHSKFSNTGQGTVKMAYNNIE